jgi:hypothetical protein
LGGFSPKAGNEDLSGKGVLRKNGGGEMTDNPENPLGLLWGAKSIGRFIGKNQRAAFRMLETGQLPGRKQGKLWVSSERELRAALTCEDRAQNSGR